VAASGTSANASAAPATRATNNRNIRIGAIVLVVVLAAVAIAYIVNRRGEAQQETIYETTTDSGLKIHEITVGTGESPKLGQTVVVHYIGWLENGTEFNNSHKMGKGEPARFVLGEVIAGWNEGLATMKVGGKRKLWVPSGLAYAARGRPGIPPNSNLIFEIELLDIQ
jgi:peptidylprolyl isomerase